jgi:hypothetical protein
MQRNQRRAFQPAVYVSKRLHDGLQRFLPAGSMQQHLSDLQRLLREQLQQLQANAVLNGSQCFCNNFYYQNALSGNCDLCHNTCLTCSGSLNNNCIQCKSNAFKNANGECICNNGFNVNGNGDCVSITCHPTCQTCFGSLSTNCLSCKSSGLLIGTNQCVCGTGLYMDNNTGFCLSCNNTCENCTGHLTQSAQAAR